MRKLIFLLVGACTLGAGGCSMLGSNPCPTMGWNVSFGTPSTLTVPSTAVVQQTSGAVSALPFASGLGPSVVSGGPVLAATPSPCGAPLTTATLAMSAGRPACTLDDVCRKLDDLARRLPVGPPSPMVKE